MVSADKAPRPALWSWVLKVLGSLQLAVVLIVVLAVVLAWATIVESSHGREYAQWFVYGSHWFVGLLGLLGINILAATMARFPWRKRIPFLVTHAGLLILLFGSIQTFMSGMEGQLTVVEGESADALMIPSQTRFTAVWPERREGRAAAFILRPGPIDWADGKTLDLGELNGVGLRMLKYLRHARVEQTWVQDDSHEGTPVLQFALHGSDGIPVHDHWLIAEQFGGIYTMGPATFQFQRLTSATMLDDFLNPLTEDLGEMGILSIHYDDDVKRVDVKEHLGEAIALEGTDVSVEIKEYLPNAMPSENAEFISKGDEASNPMLEILIHRPDSDKPIRQIAFAKHPLLNFDGIHGWTSPVKFWFHHPASASEAATEFVQTPEGKLYCRTSIDGKYQSHGEIAIGEKVPVAAGFYVSVLQHLASAREQVTFNSVASNSRDAKGAEAAVLLEVQAGGEAEQLWLQRQDPTYGFRTIATPEGSLAIGFGYEQLPLDFSVELLEFQRSKNPGRMGDASFKSLVRLVDQQEGIDDKTEISMNSPLTHGKYTFYQSSFQELPSGKEASVFTVAYDPGRFLKYLGSLMICVGSFAMFYMRRWRNGKTAPAGDKESTDRIPVPPDGDSQLGETSNGSTSTLKKCQVA